jgi:prepilin-type N-terminal cleavage/methylation domain-containing protein
MAFWKRLREQEGFTLLENMLTITLLSIGFVALLGVSSFVIQTNRSTRQMSTATALAQDRMEAIKSQSYPNILPQTEYYGSITGYENFQREVIVVANSPVADVKTVQVVVRWVDFRQHQVRLDTIVYDTSAST